MIVSLLLHILDLSILYKDGIVALKLNCYFLYYTTISANVLIVAAAQFIYSLLLLLLLFHLLLCYTILPNYCCGLL